MKNKLREWGFPAGLMVAWLITFAYTLSILAQASQQAAGRTPPVAAAPRHPSM